MKQPERKQESRVRKLAIRSGYRVEKSRQQHHANNLGQFQLIENCNNCVVLGVAFDASLDTIETYLRGPQAVRQKEGR